MIAPKMPSRTLDKIDFSTRIVPVQKAFSLFTRRSHHRPIHGFRLRLQDELLRLQEELRKTIVFVTHDFDEAVKLGDRIAILQTGSKIVQYDSPERILAEPADDFVRSFVGAGAALKQLTLTRVRDVDLHEAAVARVGGHAAEAIDAARSLDREHVIVLDDQDRPQRWMSLAELQDPGLSTASRATKNWNASTSRRRSTTPSTRCSRHRTASSW